MNDTCSCPPEAGAATCELRAATGAAACPGCGESGKSVDALTVKGLLAIPLTHVRATDYRFCRTTDCPVVYYTADGDRRFLEDDVRERVYQKHPNEDGVFVCYCFRHSIGSIRNELAGGNASTVLSAITAGIKAGQCACDIRNPQGSCCLGNVRALLQRLTNETS